MTLSEKYYAPYLLVQLIDKTTFLKISNHSIFNRCLQNSTAFDLDELSKLPEMEERFVKFLKHIEILSHDDPSKEEGQKLISLIFNIDKYKAYQNVSLQLFDQESVILEEEAITEGVAHKVQQGVALPQLQVNHARGGGVVKDDINIEHLYHLILLEKELEAIEFLRRHKLADLLHYTNPEGILNHTVYKIAENNDEKFIPVEIEDSEVNLLQFALLHKMEKLLSYIIQEHKYLSTASRELKSTDPRMIIAPMHSVDSQDETATLRLALQQGCTESF